MYEPVHEASLVTRRVYEAAVDPDEAVRRRSGKGRFRDNQAAQIPTLLWF